MKKILEHSQPHAYDIDGISKNYIEVTIKADYDTCYFDVIKTLKRIIAGYESEAQLRKLK
jgi:hypothetical protein